MALDTFDCPQCGVKLRRTSGLQPGTSVKCPKCSNQFTVPPTEAPSGPAEALSLDEPPSRRETTDRYDPSDRRDSYSDDPVPARRQRARIDDDDEDYPASERAIEGDLRTDYEIDIGKWFSYGTRHWTAFMGPFIGYALIFLLLAIPASIVPLLPLFVMPHLIAGPYVVALKILKGQNWTFGDFFTGFNWYAGLLVQTLLLALIGLACSIPIIGIYAYIIFLAVNRLQPGPELVLMLLGTLLVVLPLSIYFTIRFYWAMWLVLDRNYGGLESLKGSWKLTKNRFWMTFVIWLLMQAIQGAGASLCYVGMLFALPLVILTSTAGYMLIAGTQPPVDDDESDRPPPSPRRRDEY